MLLWLTGVSALAQCSAQHSGRRFLETVSEIPRLTKQVEAPA